MDHLTLIKPTNGLTAAADTTAKVLKTLSLLSDEASTQPAPSFKCEACRDSGFVFVKTEYRGRSVDNAQPCECRKAKTRAKLIESIPVEFRGVTVANLEPRPSIHPKQAEAVRKIKANPGGNFVLCGKFGSGKSHLFWALYRHAVEQGKKAYGGTLRALMDEYQKAIRLGKEGERYFPPITPEDFKTGQSCALFLDDFDKARATEYVTEQTFELIDAAHSNRHQIVITTNLRIGQLLKLLESADDFGRFGGAIVRRLIGNATEIELF